MKKRVFVLIILLSFISLHVVFAEETYIVKNGDTFWKIARKYDVKLDSIIKSNSSIENPNVIFPGDKIVIPTDRRNGMMKQSEKNLFHLINEKRTQLGMKSLIIDSRLSNAARLKSIDMRDKKYVSHNSPTYGDPIVLLKELKISFQFVKESIGAGHRSAEEVLSSMINSTVNLENMMDKNATHIGIGYAEGGLYGHYWTILITKK
ncbi:LysM peptidoglycan-binding domain-containing protein [Bacillus sp. Bva_UNVM-123]|uniref:LysM peptidoglycan-binding domain-containing protein n=1 Tax=Bacillus sp. Bva_UNVM-123 TaxID=2829798 RepID=UPI00391F4ED2